MFSYRQMWLFGWSIRLLVSEQEARESAKRHLPRTTKRQTTKRRFEGSEEVWRELALLSLRRWRCCRRKNILKQKSIRFLVWSKKYILYYKIGPVVNVYLIYVLNKPSLILWLLMLTKRWVKPYLLFLCLKKYALRFTDSYQLHLTMLKASLKPLKFKKFNLMKT